MVINSMNFDREKAYELVKENIKTPNLVKHSLAVEAIMRFYAERFNRDVEKWGITGLLHDVDYELTKDVPEKHGYIAKDILKEKVDASIIHAIVAHPGHIERKTLMDKVLYSCDPLSGFIVACTLMAPDKDMDNVDLRFMKKRFKSKSFAKGASREQMRTCVEFDEKLDDFLVNSLKAMKAVRKDIGL